MRTLIAATAAVLTVGAAAPVTADYERLLVQDADMLVVVDRDVPCGQPTPITVRSSDRDLFRRDSQRMQHVVDGVRAILAFECTRIPALTITGESGAPREVVFSATAGDSTGWLVDARKTVDSTPVAASTTADTPAAADLSGVTVAGLRTGMSVEQAMNAAAAELPGRPTHWPDSGLIIAGGDGCEKVMVDGERPALGQRCLLARLTDEVEPRVFQIVLRQAVDQDQSAVIADLLVARFGEPRRVSRGDDPRATWSTPPSFAHYAWRAPLELTIEGDGRPAHLAAARHVLESYLVASQARTELTIWATDPTVLGAGSPRHQAKF